jgi:hypothetical protein
VKKFLSLFFIAIVLNGCVIGTTPSVQKMENDDFNNFGNETYVWDEWTVSNEHGDWSYLDYGMDPAFP